MIRRPPRSTRTDTLFPYTTLFRSETWHLVESLWNQPSRSEWFGGGYDDPGIHSLCVDPRDSRKIVRSEEHTSELQSLMRISYAVFCLKKKKNRQPQTQDKTTTY